MFSTIIARLKTLNLFASPVTANNEYELQNERISTRLFIITLLICVLVIFIYTAQVSITQTIVIKNPSYEQFQSLSLRYPETVWCPCDNIAIPHSSFIFLEPHFHQLCSSGFIQQTWIEHIGSATGIYVSQDFSYTSSLIFLTLAAFCRRANETVMTALETFSSTRFITAQALAKNPFEEQVRSVIEGFQASTEVNYYQSFNLIRFFTQTNGLLSGQFSNAELDLSLEDSTIDIRSVYYANGTCNCGTTSLCVAPLTLQDRRINQSSSSSLFAIPGLFKGCYLMESIRQSTLECFYEASCITMLEEYLQAPIRLNNSIWPLNSAIDSRFNVSSTIDQLLSRAMTEQWEERFSHEQYFVQCDVSSCTYSFTSKFNIVYIVTILIGLVGGLTKVLRLLMPRIVKLIRRRLVPLPLMTNEPNVAHASFLERLRTFNYFSRPMMASNEQEIKQQIIATRVFFLLLVISFIALISYYSAERVTILYQIKSPTFEQFIDLENDQHSNPSFSCPCSAITVAYGKFIHANYTLHPFCSSVFAQPQWLKQLQLRNSYSNYDFRFVAPSFLYSLASLCEVSAEHIDNSLMSFAASFFIADQALSPKTFVSRTNATIETFMSSISRSLGRSFALISNITQSNVLICTHHTNFYFYLSGTYPSFYLNYDSAFHNISVGDSVVPCGCFFTEKCIDPLSIYPYIFINGSDDRFWSVPGLFLGCLPMDGIYRSTLICLFNQSCIDSISFWLNISSVDAIDTHDLIRFYINSTIEDIINEVFVDQWNYSVSHRAFYQQCRPDRCTYSLNENNSLWVILTVIISLIGGLMKILQIITPYLVRGVFLLYSRYRRPIQRETAISASVPFTFSFKVIIDRIRKLNLFLSDNPITIDNEYETRNQIISTRVFLVLLLGSLIILTVYSSQVQVTKTATIANPSLQQYISLYDGHSATLTCPCKNIAIFQQTFLNIRPTYHQVCGSDFVNPLWFNGIPATLADITVYSRDFRLLGDAIFDTIASLCQLSLMTIDQGLLVFDEASFVTAQIIPQDLLLKQGQALIDTFVSTSENAFISSLQSIIDTTHANALLSFDSTSLFVLIDALNETNLQLATYLKIYNTSSSSCTCYFNPTCTEPAGLYTYPEKKFIYAIPGFFIGCYIFTATLKSNLASLYNQSWIDDFRATIEFDYYSPSYVKTTALNSSLVSQYNITTPINVMMQKMMTERWYTNINYSAYYDQCDPIECKYIYIIKYDLVYIITTIIGLIGGLVTILQLVIPRAVKLIRRCWFNRCRYTRVQVFPVIEIPENN